MRYVAHSDLSDRPTIFGSHADLYDKVFYYGVNPSAGPIPWARINNVVKVPADRVVDEHNGVASYVCRHIRRIFL